MPFSLDTPSASTLKAEAKALRQERALTGKPLTHGAALEEISHRHGYRDWNTARAALPDRVKSPVQVGLRVKGAYLGQDFTGVVIGVEMVSTAQLFRIIVMFDQPVDVVKFESFSAFRKRVSATVDVHGVSPARTSDGQPHMRLQRA